MKDFKENFNLKDWKVHVLCFVIMVIAELIGTIKITMNGARGGGISFSLIPMLFAILIGIILGGAKKIKKETMITASPYISICVMFLIVKLSCSIGPSWSKIVDAGDRVARFDPNIAEHVHFHCTKCGKVVDIDAPELIRSVMQRDFSGVGRASACSICLQGICKECEAAGGASSEATQSESKVA